MDQQRRLLLFVAVSVGLSVAWSQFVIKPRLEAEAAAQAAAADAGTMAVTSPAPSSGEQGVDGGVAAEQAGAEAMAAGGTPVAPTVTPRSFVIKRPSMDLTFTNEGAGLTDAVLQGPREKETRKRSLVEGWKQLFGATFEPAPQMDLADPSPATAPQLGVSIRGEKPLAPRLVYEVVEQGPTGAVFRGQQGPWQVEKTFRWSTDEKGAAAYAFELDVKVTNVSSEPAAGSLIVHTTRAIGPDGEEAPSLFGGIGNQASVLCHHGDDVTRETPKSDPEVKKESGTIGFVGIDQQYFLSAVWPREATTGGCELLAVPERRDADLVLPLSLGPGASTTQRLGAFLGPKDLELLTAVDGVVAGAKPGLEKTVDFGIWAFLCKVLLFFLRLFHGFTGNWGVAIILLTVMVKLILLPLTHKAMVSAEQMKGMQPKLEEIKKKHPDDREKQNAEMMRLYQEAGVNPLGGCLPLLLQLPIWGALFTTLRTSYELYGEPFIGPVWTDLTFKDPTYLLPLALGVTMIITQRFQPQMGDQTQAFMMTWVMPVFFTAMMMNYPAGLALYIFTNNLLSIVQQFALRRYLEAKKNGGGITAKGATT